MTDRVVVIGGGTGRARWSTWISTLIVWCSPMELDFFGLERDDFIPQVKDIITVGESYGLAAGGQIIFT